MSVDVSSKHFSRPAEFHSLANAALGTATFKDDKAPQQLQPFLADINDDSMHCPAVTCLISGSATSFQAYRLKDWPQNRESLKLVLTLRTNPFVSPTCTWDCFSHVEDSGYRLNVMYGEAGMTVAQIVGPLVNGHNIVFYTKPIPHHVARARSRAKGRAKGKGTGAAPLPCLSSRAPGPATGHSDGRFTCTGKELVLRQLDKKVKWNAAHSTIRLGYVPLARCSSDFGFHPSTEKYFDLYETLHDIFMDACPWNELKNNWTTIQINRNYRHKDDAQNKNGHCHPNNDGYSCVTAIGDFRDGNFFSTNENGQVSDVSFHGRGSDEMLFKEFDGKLAHGARPYDGTRYSIVFYSSAKAGAMARIRRGDGMSPLAVKPGDVRRRMQAAGRADTAEAAEAARADFDQKLQEAWKEKYEGLREKYEAAAAAAEEEAAAAAEHALAAAEAAAECQIVDSGSMRQMLQDQTHIKAEKQAAAGGIGGGGGGGGGVGASRHQDQAASRAAAAAAPVAGAGLGPFKPVSRSTADARPFLRLVAEDNATLKQIAERDDRFSAEQLLAWNREVHPGLTLTARLRAGTQLLTEAVADGAEGQRQAEGWGSWGRRRHSRGGRRSGWWWRFPL